MTVVELKRYDSTETEVDCDPFIDSNTECKGQILHIIGGFGKWQLQKTLFIIATIWLPASFHLLNMVFYRADTDFWCKSLYPNWSVERWRNFSSPIDPKTNKPDSCVVYDVDFSVIDNEFPIPEGTPVRKCLEWDFDRSFWTRTIIQEWNLVCDRRDLQKLTQQVTFFGLLVGVFVAGMMSDKFGRIPTTMSLLLGVSIFGTLTAFAPTYELFLVGIWFCGFCSIGSGTILYCWMMELVSGREKTILGCAPHFNYAFWGLITCVIAYCVPDWRKMQLIFSVPLLLLLVTYWILPESPRWLHSHGHDAKAEKIVREIAQYNGITLPDDFRLEPLHKEPPKGKGIFGVFELFKTPNLRRNTFIVYYMWFATSLVYYGLTLNSNDLLFLYFSMGKLIEFPAILLVTALLLKAGRRLSLMILYFVCGVSLLCSMLVTKGKYPWDWPLIIMNILGRGCATGTLAICYVYSAEIFPTVIRNAGIGSSSLWARIGPMMAPFIKDLSVYDARAPIAAFGVIAIIASFSVTFLPETHNHKLADTLEEGERMGHGDNFYTSITRKEK